MCLRCACVRSVTNSANFLTICLWIVSFSANQRDPSNFSVGSACRVWCVFPSMFPFLSQTPHIWKMVFSFSESQLKKTTIISINLCNSSLLEVVHNCFIFLKDIFFSVWQQMSKHRIKKTVHCGFEDSVILALTVRLQHSDDLKQQRKYHVSILFTIYRTVLYTRLVCVCRCVHVE